MINGTWEKEGHQWVFTNAEFRAFVVPKEVTYTELVDLLYEKFELDRFAFDLKLEVPYAVGTIPVGPAVLKDNGDVSHFMKHKYRNRFPLCVSLVPKQIEVIAPIAYRGVCKGKDVEVGMVSRNEPKKRRNTLVIEDRQNDPIIENKDGGCDDDLFNEYKGAGNGDEVYRRDRDCNHNSDEYDGHNGDEYEDGEGDENEGGEGDENEGSDGDEENSDGYDGDNNGRGEEFEEFANPEEYEEFVETFTVPTGHCEPSSQCQREPPMIGSPIVPYSWKAPEFTADDVVKEEPSHYPSHSSTGNLSGFK